jgi:lipid II:glycine glycyltransferase (peptidoglycan interpeptide bridge formation enzyme)
MSFKLISPSKEKWNDFVDSNIRSSVFQRHEMCDVYSKTKNMEGIRLAVSDEHGKILACMVIRLESKKFLKPLTSVSIIENAPLYEDSEQGKKAAEFIIRHYGRFIRRKALYSNVKIDRNSFLEKLYESEGYEKTACLNFEIRLDRDPEKVFMQIHKSRRKNIRKTAKLGIDIIDSNESSLPDFYSLLKETYSKLGLLVPDISFFYAAFELMQPNVKMFLARYKGEFIAGRIEIVYRKKIFDWYAGASSLHLNLFPNDAMVWHVLEYGCKNGCELFDFGGAGVADEEYGVREFKKRFGGQLVEYSSFKKIHRPVIANLGSRFLSVCRKIF